MFLVRLDASRVEDLVQDGAYRGGDLRCAIATLFVTPPSLCSGAPHKSVMLIPPSPQRGYGGQAVGTWATSRGFLIENVGAKLTRNLHKPSKRHFKRHHRDATLVVLLIPKVEEVALGGWIILQEEV